MLMTDERGRLLRCGGVAALSCFVLLAARCATLSTDGSTDAILADGLWEITQEDNVSIGGPPLVGIEDGMPSSFVLSGCELLLDGVTRSNDCTGGMYTATGMIDVMGAQFSMSVTLDLPVPAGRATIQLDYRGTIETPELITGQVVQNFGEGEADEVDTFTMTRIGNVP